MRYFLAVMGIVAVGTIYYMLNPENYAFFPKCPFLALTGWQCPGCGSQRAVHALLHLNFKQAFVYNPLLVVSIPYIIAAVFFNTDFAKRKCPQTRNLMFGQRAIWVVLVLILLFAVFRNF